MAQTLGRMSPGSSPGGSIGYDSSPGGHPPYRAPYPSGPSPEGGKWQRLPPGSSPFGDVRRQPLRQQPKQFTQSSVIWVPSARRGLGEQPKVAQYWGPIDMSARPTQVAAPTLPAATVPIRPARGRQGTAVTNSFSVGLPTGCFHLYTVSFIPNIPVDSFKLRRALALQAANLGDRAVYDGDTAMYTLDEVPDEVIVARRHAGAETQHRVLFTFNRTLSWGDVTTHHIQVFNIVFRRALLRRPGCCRMGRNTFDVRENTDMDIENRAFGLLRMVPGLQSSLYCTDLGPLLTMDLVFKVLARDSVADVLKRNPRDRRSALVGRSCLISYSNRIMTITDVDYNASPEDVFTAGRDPGRPITYSEYVLENYPGLFRKEDIDPMQPLLISVDRSTGKERRFIPQFCYLTGLSPEMLASRGFMQDLRGRIGRTPAERAELIQSLVLPPKKEAPEFWKTLDQWGFKIMKKFLQVETLTLPACKVEFGCSATAPPEMAGKWEVFDRSTRVNHPMYSTSGQPRTFMVSETTQQNTDELMANIVEKAQAMQVLGEYETVLTRGPEAEDYLDALKDIVARTEGEPTLAVVILVDYDDSPGNVYTRIKNYALRQRNLVTQCAIAGRGQKGGPGVKAQMIGVQVCAKLMGTPWKTTSQTTFADGTPMDVDQGTLVLGMDVQSSPSKDHSVLALVGLLDLSTAANYSTCVRVPTGTTITTEGFGRAVHDAVMAYQHHNRAVPRRVVVYRSGVQEADIPDMRRTEIEFLEQVLLTEGDIPLTYLMVVPSAPRLFAQEGPTSSEIGNPTPGTIMDGPSLSHEGGPYSFIMTAQRVLEGAVNPSKFTCLHNTAQLCTGELHSLSYMLCHSFFNYFGTVKVPSPCVYASRLSKFVCTHTDPDSNQCVLPRQHHGLYFI